MNCGLYNLLRELTKSNYYQTLYANKEIVGCIFENKNNFSDAQIFFLNYLAFYNSLFIDIGTGDVNKLVLKNFVFEDAYSYYKSKEREKKIAKKVSQPPPEVKNNKRKDVQTTSFKWVFKKPPQKD